MKLNKMTTSNYPPGTYPDVEQVSAQFRIAMIGEAMFYTWLNAPGRSLAQAGREYAADQSWTMSDDDLIAAYEVCERLQSS